MLIAPEILLNQALESDDVAAMRSLVRAHPALLTGTDQRPVITRARSLAAAEALLESGATIDAVGEWWASGFEASAVAPEMARWLVKQGVPLTPHAAAALGLVDSLRGMLAADPSLVKAKGGDGGTPLHFARDVETVRLLVIHGAPLDARDDDHDSTPAQWLIRRSPEAVRFLLARGATPDIFLAAALGDLPLARRLVESDPSCVSCRIGRLPGFPPIGYQGRGGTILQWTLAFNSHPHQIALRNGHQEMFDFLYERSDTATRLLVCCLLARRSQALEIAAANPGLVAALPAADLELVARYSWETNTNVEAVRLMLDVGFPVDHTERSHGYSPLHNAAWSGSGDLVDLLIARGAQVVLRDPVYHATPLGWAIHCATVEKRHPEGEYPRVVQSLLAAGCPAGDIQLPTGDPRIDAVFLSR